MKKLLTLLGVALLATSAYAVPARPLTTKVSQSDGTTLSITVRGDERFHYCLTTDGLPVLRAADGNFYYAQTTDGQLVATAQLAHDEALRSVSEKAFVASQVATADQLQTLAAAANVRRMATQKAKTALRKQAEGLGAPRKVNSGKRRGLVILVNYQDVKMDETHTQEVFDAMFNEVGYTENSNTMSVHDYFYEQSYGQFDLSFDVVGPVTVSSNMAYYGGNDRYGNDKRPGEMVYEACQLVDDDVDFTTYDWDGDGEAEMVFVVYAGYGEASDAYSGKLDDTIWPHMYYLTSYGLNLTLDGVKIDTYACSSELVSNSGTRMDGIGTACHEFSHCFGLPDLYDTSSSTSNFGMSYWSILDIGCYGGDGFGPVGYTSYERWASGWLEPTELTDTTSITGMKSLVEAPEAYVIYNDAYNNEYYLLENRQAVSSDAYLPGHGMLVLHVDYDETTWWYNTVNNTSNHQRCTIIAADNTYNKYSGLAGDPYPGTSGKTELSDTSIPRATLYNANTDGAKYMHKPILNIAETDEGLISFDFLGVKQVETGIQAVKTGSVGLADAVSVFNAAGQQVCATTYADFLTMPLKHGVYVVRSAQGAFKVAK